MWIVILYKIGIKKGCSKWYCCSCVWVYIYAYISMLPQITTNYKYICMLVSINANYKYNGLYVSGNYQFEILFFVSKKYQI